MAWLPKFLICGQAATGASMAGGSRRRQSLLGKIWHGVTTGACRAIQASSLRTVSAFPAPEQRKGRILPDFRSGQLRSARHRGHGGDVPIALRCWTVQRSEGSGGTFFQPPIWPHGRLVSQLIRFMGRSLRKSCGRCGKNRMHEFRREVARPRRPHADFTARRI